MAQRIAKQPKADKIAAFFVTIDRNARKPR
jgi:hypothetical protein